ncbi:hypothetical protein ONZ43_g3927 [Nemania bipapillata]|uniref:Uncharacterized protein n=1 Tax=Nemania bipapillata TaxID=110536 RepID=A0ACC2IU72_9PEZI|nr:hypothetical protein ONZ43_g3927 [Nemania bipapillata]
MLPQASGMSYELATVRHEKKRYNPVEEQPAVEEGSRDPIRSRLRKWQDENPTQAEAMLSDFADQGELNNNITRPQNVGMVQIDVDDSSPLFAGDELVDLRSADAMLGAGDLVELYSEGTRRPLLAICLGRIHGYEHFYTTSGKWFSAASVKTLFVVNNFATPDDMKAVIEALPTATVSIEELNILQDLGEGPSQSAGAELLRKMLQFAQKAEAVYQANAGTLDASSSFIGNPTEHRYLTLHEITDLLLPDTTKHDIEILQFVELWASYQKFPQYSSLQTIGSAILRAIDRYQEGQGYLPSTGWTFLQEVGWIPPWEIPARYTVRLPGVGIKRGGSYVRPLTDVLDKHLKPDMLARIREPLSNTTAYCIDDITAREIDDAVSLERTSNPEEYWIHVHVADPASSFGADSPLAQYAELLPEAIYLPGHLESMLPEDLIHAQFSLASDRPCLTFSALVNSAGVVLEEKVASHTLKNVVYMTYEDAASAIGEVRENPFAEDARWSLGVSQVVKPVNRKMTRPDELTEDQKDDLSILSKLGKAIQAGRLEKGATPIFLPRPTATVDFDGVQQKESGGFIAASGDPLIHIQYSRPSGTDLVENAMKLANEVAARWCYERGIPIPYRTQPHASRNAALVQQYARDVLNPMLNSGVRPNEQVWRQMQSLLGIDEVSTTPGQHFTLGSDMYAKATSPLRRFGDLIVHWQIEATLLEEKKLGHKINGKTSRKVPGDDLSFLPFSRERLDRMLPMMRLREKQARNLTNIDGTDQWILQALVRAWRFNEGTLPETFKLTVTHLSRTRIMGRLDWFERSAILKHEALNDVALGADVRVGDVFEVRLTNVSVFAKRIFVEALRLLEKAGVKNQGLESAQAPLDAHAGAI